MLKETFCHKTLFKIKVFFTMHIFFFCHKYYLPLKIIFNEQNFYLSVKLFSDGLLRQYSDNIFFCGKNIFDMKIQPFVIKIFITKHHICCSVSNFSFIFCDSYSYCRATNCCLVFHPCLDLNLLNYFIQTFINLVHSTGLMA